MCIRDSAYPGKEILEKGKKRLSALVQIQAPLEFFKTVFDEQDDLMDFGEDYEPDVYKRQIIMICGMRKQMERIILWMRQLIRKNSLSNRRWKTS